MEITSVLRNPGEVHSFWEKNKVENRERLALQG